MSNSLQLHSWSTPGFSVHHQLLEPTQTHVYQDGDAIQPSNPLSSPSPPAFNLSHYQGLFQWVSSSHQVAKVWSSPSHQVSFSFSICPSNEYSGWISFRIDWFDFLAVQGTLKSLLQHHSSKASVLQYSDFFMVQLSHPYTTTGKTIALTRWAFVSKVMSLLLNMLSAAKLLQLCPTLCNPINGSPPGSTVPGILQAITPEWVAISFSSARKWKGKVKSLSHVRFFATSWTATCQASLSITKSRSLLKLMSIESVMPSNHLILCHPLLLLPSIFPSIRVFSKESVLHIRWPKYWSFSFSISPSREYSGLISFRIDWLYLLIVQGTLKSLFQHHSSKASILRCSAFFIVQLSHTCMTTGKTIALTRQAFVSKVMPLLFNILFRLVIAFLPRSKHLLISWLQSPSAVIVEPLKIVSHCFHYFPIYLPWNDGTRSHDLRFLNVEF